MMDTKEQCENAAEILGLPDTSASPNAWNDTNCHGQSYYRCTYYTLLTALYWNPACGDNSNSDNRLQNLCIATGT